MRARARRNLLGQHQVSDHGRNAVRNAGLAGWQKTGGGRWVAMPRLALPDIDTPRSLLRGDLGFALHCGALHACCCLTDVKRWYCCMLVTVCLVGVEDWGVRVERDCAVAHFAWEERNAGDAR
jgi:hypothetical protein